MVVTQTNRLLQTAHTGKILDDRFLMPNGTKNEKYKKLSILSNIILINFSIRICKEFR